MSYRPRVDNAHEPVDPRPLLDLDRVLFPRLTALFQRHVQEMRSQKLMNADDPNLSVLQRPLELVQCARKVIAQLYTYCGRALNVCTECMVIRNRYE